MRTDRGVANALDGRGGTRKLYQGVFSALDDRDLGSADLSC